MSDNIDNALGQLKNILSSVEGQKKIEGLLNSVTQGGADATIKTSSSGLNIDSFAKIKNIIDKMQLYDDPRINLLNSLRPYISKTRNNQIDNAVKIMALGKLPYLLKNNTKGFSRM